MPPETAANEDQPLTMSNRPSSFLLTLGLVATSLGAWTLARFDPTAESWFPKCMLHQLTGLHCPGCGSTRALHALFNGNIFLAIRFNPLFLVGLPTLAAWIFVNKRLRPNKPVVTAAFAALVIAGFLIYFIARNVPSPETSLFAPPAL